MVPGNSSASSFAGTVKAATSVSFFFNVDDLEPIVINVNWTGSPWVHDDAALYLSLIDVQKHGSPSGLVAGSGGQGTHASIEYSPLDLGIYELDIICPWNSPSPFAEFVGNCNYDLTERPVTSGNLTLIAIVSVIVAAVAVVTIIGVKRRLFAQLPHAKEATPSHSFMPSMGDSVPNGKLKPGEISKEDVVDGYPRFIRVKP